MVGDSSRPALLAPDRPPLGYRELVAQIDAIGAQLAGLGIGGEDRVAVVLPNGPEMAVAFLAVASTAVCTPLNPRYQAKEFDFYISDLNARALIVPAGSTSPAVEVARARGVAVVELVVAPDDAAGRFRLIGSGTPIARVNRSGADVALVLHTSGTTSRPKIVPLSHDNLLASARSVCAALQLTETDRCLNVMPLFHIHGLVGVVLSSLSAGASVVCTPGFDQSSFVGWMEAHAPTWYSAVPTMHQAVLARIRSHGAPKQARLRLIRSASSPLPPQVMAELEQTFTCPVIEAYGMTEGSHQICSNPLPPRARKPGSVGVAAGPQVAVMDELRAFVAPGQSGEVVVRGPGVTYGYQSNPEANHASFVDGWFRTGDLGHLDEEGYLFLTGRLKEQINRGGQKVAPREVDEALLDHPAVAQAVTFGASHPKLGEEVAAAVVLRAPATVDERELRRFVGERLAYYKVPKRVVFLDELPKGPTGKPQRIGLAQRLGVSFDVTAPATGSAAPRTPFEQLLAGLWSEALGISSVDVDVRFFDLGGDSITATQLVARVHERLQVELSLLDFLDAPTIADMAVLLASRMAADPASEQLLGDLETLSDEEMEAQLAGSEK